MKVVLKPLFEAELPAGFEDIVREKLRGRELKTGETVEVELLGKPLPFKVLLAEPSPLKVGKGTKIEFSAGEVEEFTLEFESEVDDAIPFAKGLVVVLGSEVRIYNWSGQKVYSREFENLKKVRAAEGKVVVVHGREVTVVEP
ncbi:ATPase [Thermococcus sp. AM4]|uniref:DUF6849 domain-containing protein n=1 Tax=Thermococcus sp. (strain AM4) TaxID=246969 RepID=UPI0001870D0C|nr:ATPase [Thermococcus sp. AM4]EEB73258.1 Cell division protein 48 (CDC48), domain 2 [Thermococcus sp. AM4]